MKIPVPLQRYSSRAELGTSFYRLAPPAGSLKKAKCLLFSFLAVSFPIFVHYYTQRQG